MAKQRDELKALEARIKNYTQIQERMREAQKTLKGQGKGSHPS